MLQQPGSWVGAACVVAVAVLASATTAAGQPKWKARSSASHFMVDIGPLDFAVSIGNFHSWTISVRDRNGRDVDNAHITIAGGMVDHGHGLPSQPLVTQYLGSGKYLIEGMLFNMAGSWTLVVNIQTASLDDQVRFNIDLEF